MTSSLKSALITTEKSKLIDKRTHKKADPTAAAAVVARDIRIEMFMWNDGQPEHPFSSQIYAFWSSHRVPQVLNPVKEILFDGVDSYTIEDISRVAETVDPDDHHRIYRNHVDLAISCFEPALISGQLQVKAANTTDITTNKEKKNNGNKNDEGKEQDQISDDNILRISFACLYYCKAISTEFFLPADMATLKLQKSFSNQIAYLDRSLLQYPLSKTRIRMCQAWLLSHLKNSKEELEQTINDLLAGVVFNPKLYTQEEYTVCIEQRIKSIKECIQVDSFFLAPRGGCVIL